MNASDCFERRETKNVLRPEDVERIAAAFHDEEPQEGFSTFATREDVAKNDYNLTVRRYVGGSEEVGEALTFTDALAAYRAAQQQRLAVEQELAVVLAAIESETAG